MTMHLRNNKEMKKLSFACFLPLYFSRYFRYGYLFLLLLIIATIAIVASLGISIIILKIIIILLAFLIGIYAFVRLLNILFSTKYKWRYYNITIYRLKTRGFNETYFENEMYEPCMRLIIKDLIYNNNNSNNYKKLQMKYINDNYSIDDAKNHLIASLIENEISP
jgi:energy-coupling factor transporter transmembrane protein EcfT